MTREQSLRRAVTISLFTWRRAGPDDVVDDSDRKGWWGDSVPSVAGDKIGSRLWLLSRRTLVADTLKDAQAYEQSLRVLIDDEGGPGKTLLTTHVRAAISNTPGEVDHVLFEPVVDVSIGPNQVAVPGVFTWI